MWMNAQFARQSITEDGQVITIEDIHTFAIINAVKRLLVDTELSLDELINGFVLIPCLKANRIDTDVVIEALPWIFARILNNEKGLSVNAYDLVRHAEQFQNKSANQHVSHSNTRQPDQEPILAYINLTSESNQPLSATLNRTEMLGIRGIFEQTKYNGCRIPDQAFWDEMFLSAAFRRLLDLGIFACVVHRLTPQTAKTYHALVKLSNAHFQPKHGGINAYYSSDGSLVARKFTRFPESNANSTTTLTVNDTSSGTIECKGDDIPSTWGQF